MFIKVGDIPYLKQFPNDGRIRPIMTYFDGQEWHSYYLQPDGKVLDFKPVDFVSGTYLAKVPARESDVEIPLLSFLFQRLPTTETFDAFSPLYNDLENALAILHKQFILFRHFVNSADGSYAAVVSTELEYALFNHRSAYDLFNGFAVAFLERHGLNKNQIPNSFQKVAQKSHEARVSHGFSSSLSNFYATKKNKFMVLRDVRDAIAHGGRSVGIIFKLPKGFGLNGDSLVGYKLKSGDLWEALKPAQNDIGSCLAFLALLAEDLFTALEDFTRALVESFTTLPPETAPGHRVYARSRLFEHRTLLPEYLANPWRIENTPKDL